jgi:hypothetical protein
MQNAMAVKRNAGVAGYAASRAGVPAQPPVAVSPEILIAIAAGLPVPVAPGRHPVAGDHACLMELASALAREPWSDHPACVHPVLGAVARAVNDRVGDAAREWLAPLVPTMIGTADAGPDGWPRPERCAQLVLLCARTALRLSPFMAAEMESARLTALSVLSRPAGFPRGTRDTGGPSHPAGLSRPAGPSGPDGAQKNGTAVRRGAAALLDRFGLLSRLYPRQAAVEAAQAVSVIAGAGPAATRQAATRRDAHLCQLLRACTELCADDAPPPAPGRGAHIQDALPAGA